MKSNRSMKHGGKLKPEYYDFWAQIIVRYLQEYRKRGIVINRLTMQNEPNAKQLWESCLMTANEEAEFAINHMKPALRAAGLDDVKVLIWDHNKDQIIERVETEMAKPNAQSNIDGVGFHWYSGDHFESIAELTQQFPDKEFLMTEGCVEYSGEWKTDTKKAEQYAHDIIGDLNAGAMGYIDWNMLLDENGGPNHMKNYCAAPLMYNRETKVLEVKPSFVYIGHFSRFIKPGAQRVLTSTWTPNLEAVAAVNPDGQHVLVVLNCMDWEQDCNVNESGCTATFTMKPHSIATLTWMP